jgi:cold shock CspA family protein
VSGQIEVPDADKPVESRFFGKPLDVEQMIVELRGMVGAGSLAIVAKPRAPISETEQECLTAENEGLRLLLEQADIDAKALILRVGIDAKEREASDKLQTLIVEELHHRIKNTLAIVSVITSQSLRTAATMDHGRKAIESRLGARGRSCVSYQPWAMEAPRSSWRPTMARGTVKWFNSQKGYGFIQPQGGGGKDVFVHISAVERAGLPGLSEGQTVEYEEVSNRGKTSAENLKVSR